MPAEAGTDFSKADGNLPMEIETSDFSSRLADVFVG